MRAETSMPYTRITLMTLGSENAIVSCDLETGEVLATNRTHDRRKCDGLLRVYAPLERSTNLDERCAFDVIQATIAERFPACIRRKKMRLPTRLELLGLVNEPGLDLREPNPQYFFSYRDTWSVLIRISGANVPCKSFGPFSFIDPASKAERIIDVVSENGKLFFF